MAKKTISRTQFLRGDYRGRNAIMRPPWSLAEDEFVEQCTRCGGCLKACPENILITGRGGFPQIDFAKGECTFCQKCQQVCAEPVFRSTEQRAWFYQIEFTDRCLSKNGVVCVTCAEQCEAAAIHFVPRVGAAPEPQLDAAVCTACGACYQPCPVNAIQFQQSPTISNTQPSQRLEAYP